MDSTALRYDTGMKHRKLRIVWLVAWGLVAVMLCLLWVRSYSFQERISVPMTRSYWIECISEIGTIDFIWRYWGTPGWDAYSHPLREQQLNLWGYWGFDAESFRGGSALMLPYWFLAGVLLCSAIGPWVSAPRRYSLRTLLIATTLIAVGLGLTVLISRAG